MSIVKFCHVILISVAVNRMPFIIPLGEIDDKLPVGWKAMPSHAIRRPKTYRQKLKVKNCCSQCRKKWTSMRGLAEFKIGTSLSKATKIHVMSIVSTKMQEM